MPYQTFSFGVTATGPYAFQSVATNGWDNYSFLYSPTFDATQPFSNVIIGNDDNPSIGLSGFSTNLTAGASYVFVETGFSNTDVGPWTLDVTGPGSVVVPEPATVGLAAVGLLATARRRR